MRSQNSLLSIHPATVEVGVGGGGSGNGGVGLLERQTSLEATMPFEVFRGNVLEKVSHVKVNDMA